MTDNAGTDRSGGEAVRQVSTTIELVFDPATLRVLQEAFDMAWREAVTLPIVRTDEQGARDFIAERTVRAAGMTDERDPDRHTIPSRAAADGIVGPTLEDFAGLGPAHCRLPQVEPEAFHKKFFG